MGQWHRQNTSEGATVELSDADIYDAMRHISGYIDITTEDFRLIYRLAYQHALRHIGEGLQARDLMTHPVVAVEQGTRFENVARTLADAGVKSAPVLDGARHVVGVVTEKDYLRFFNARSFIEFLAHRLSQAESLQPNGREIPVDELMSTPALTLHETDSFAMVLRTFQDHAIGSIPIVNPEGVLTGIVTRGDFVHGYHLEGIA
jgi:CBS-domain-containing membrane protein